jgi:hypothetical protein
MGLLMRQLGHMSNIVIEKEEFLEKIVWDWRMIIFRGWVPNALKTIELLEWQNSLIRESSINLRAQTYLLQSMGFVGNPGLSDSRDTVETG